VLAGEREQILVRAGIAADAGEAVLQHAEGEERISALGDDGMLGALLAREALVVDRVQAMQMVAHPAKQRRRLRGVGACRRYAPPMPHRVCALRDRRAPSIRTIRVRTVTVPLRDGLFRRNVHATPV
jgi:hypothetical protein